MLYKTISNAYELKEEFEKYDRDHYSLDAYDAIIDYYDQLDQNHELDVVELCSIFEEETPENIVNDYSGYEDCVDEAGDIDDYLLLQEMNEKTYAILLDNDKILFINY